MKTFITSLTNTYKAMRLLSDPTVGAYLQSQMQKSAAPALHTDAGTKTAGESTFGTKNAFYHKHYIVQIL